ncbi:MAG TPA: hypothetical protein VHA11_04415, partial [Bryobacteraceae bacterium]|nr:hypothetical protein [Bryobacteraceae bacterium]
MNLANVFSAVESGAVVLTANNRVARSLRHAYAERQREIGWNAWRTPEILPWGAWVGRCWEDALYSGAQAPPALLSAEQAGAAWERAIAEDPEGHPLLQVAATARQAAAAWELAQSWKLDFQAEEWQWNDETRAFLRWAAGFQARCEREGWLDQARLPEAVAAHFRAGALRAPNRLLLIGFDEFTPRQKDLWAALRNAGCQVQQADGASGRIRAVLADLAGTEEEIRAAARWARRLLEQGSERIGVIVPDLARVRPVVDRIFREVMYPGEMFVDPRRSCYNISFGVPLVEYPLISTALRILEMAPEAVPVETASRLLRSPFLRGASPEWTARALLDARVAALGDTGIEIKALIELAREQKGCFCPRFAGALEAWRERRRGLPERQRPSRWAAAISELLEAVGWPGDRVLDSVEYQ